jgi:hypothetical protein
VQNARLLRNVARGKNEKIDFSMTYDFCAIASKTASILIVTSYHSILYAI